MKALAAKKNCLIYGEIITSAVNLFCQLPANLSRYLDQQVNILYTNISSISILIFMRQCDLMLF